MGPDETEAMQAVPAITRRQPAPEMLNNGVRYPVTPDGRYFVVRGRLWRCSNPQLPPARRAELTHELMDARRDQGRAMRARDDRGRELTRQRIDGAKEALGERGAVWCTDGASDWNRRMARNTPYAEWFATLPSEMNGELKNKMSPLRYEDEVLAIAKLSIAASSPGAAEEGC